MENKNKDKSLTGFEPIQSLGDQEIGFVLPILSSLKVQLEVDLEMAAKRQTRGREPSGYMRGLSLAITRVDLIIDNLTYRLTNIRGDQVTIDELLEEGPKETPSGLYTAEEARRDADYYHTAQKELNGILGDIKIQANSGKTSLYVRSLTELTIRSLDGLGYRIKHYSDTRYKIVW